MRAYGRCERSGKVRFPKNVAERKARIARRVRGDERMAAYCCRSCGAWHIGHNSSRRMKPKPRRW